ncbi:MAG: hypothetical protein VZR06_14695 [Butyrivibrio sp.]|jgi:hypothetical protein|nr:hypothetical protein [Butyrivibrio sp.]
MSHNATKSLAEGTAKRPSMGFINNEMKMLFKDDICLTECWGPVQMCVYRMDYIHIPSGYKIIFECERGVIVAQIANNDIITYLTEIYPEANYLHYENKEADLKHLINLVYKAISDI